MIEPTDCFLNTQDGLGTAGASSTYGWKKAFEVVELGNRLNGIIEDLRDGETDPVQIHNIGFGWPL